MPKENIEGRLSEEGLVSEEGMVNREVRVYRVHREGSPSVCQAAPPCLAQPAPP